MAKKNIDKQALEEYYSEIVEDIRKERTVLLLGPELSVNNMGIDYRSYFKNIEEVVNIEHNEYYPDENLFSLDNSLSRRDILRKIKKFYKDAGDKVLLELISRIKFPLIINVAPDEALVKTYEEENIEHRYNYFSIDYHRSNNNWNDSNPSMNNPIIYNIFGTIEDERSIIVSHNKLYKTIESLLMKSSLPDCIQSYIDGTQSFIFLGFKFDSWYYQLLCHKLKIFENSDNFRTSLSSSLSKKNNSLMEKHFKMVFTPDNPTQTIDNIINICNENNQDLIRENDVKDHLSLFISYAWGNDNTIDRDTIVTLCESYLSKNYSTVNFLRDKNTMTFGDSIDSFMTRIGMGKSVIRVISDKYLKSSYCMTEALRISKYSDNEKRVFTIVWDDIKTIEHYEDYWKEKSIELASEAQNSDSKYESMGDNFQNYFEIRKHIRPFLKDIKDTIALSISKKDFSRDDLPTLKSGKQKEFEKFINDVYNKMIGN